MFASRRRGSTYKLWKAKNDCTKAIELSPQWSSLDLSRMRIYVYRSKGDAVYLLLTHKILREGAVRIDSRNHSFGSLKFAWS